MANQITIDIGAAANDGTGDPLRTAFNYVNDNFSNVWNTGLPNSNVQFSDNRILTVNTNANLVLTPNGIGKVVSNVGIVPNMANVHDLGSSTRRWNTIYAQYLTISNDVTFADLTVDGNLTVTGNTIQIGNIVTDTKTIQLANTASTANAANGSGVTVGANDNIATLLYNSTSNVWTTNIGISSVGNVTAPYFFGNGSQLTGLPATYANANAVAYGESGWAGNIIPGGNAVYSLGNATNQWNDLYVSNATIFMNNVPISLSAGNVLTVNGNAVLQNNSNSSIATTGNITAGNVLTGGVVSATGNVTGGNILTGAQVIASGVIESGTGFSTGGYLSVDGSADLHNTTVTGNLSATGNITANVGSFFIGNGSQLTGIVSSYGNANVVANLAALGSNPISTTGNVTSGNVSTGVITLTNGATIRDTGGDAVAFGQNAGLTSQGNFAVGIGRNAGQTTQGGAAVAIGVSAGDTSQGNSAVAVGQSAGFTDQSANTVAVGVGAGQSSQGVNAVAVGASAGSLTQGIAAVAIGTLAGRTFQANNSIIINATGANLDQTTANTFTVAPVRNDVANIGQVMFYNSTSKEVTYGNTISVAGNITGNYIFGNGSQLTGISTANTGNVTFNNQAVVGTGDQQGASGLYLAPGNASVGNLQYIRVRGGDVATHIHLDTGNNAYFDQYFGDDGKYVKLEAAGNIVINTNDGVGNSAQWTFDNFSRLTLPGGSQIRPLGANLDIIAGTGAYVNLTTSDESSSVGVDNTGGYITTAGGTWDFGTTGNLTAPGNVSAVGNITSGNVSTAKITLTNGAVIKDTAGDAVAFGQQAGQTTQGDNSVAIGTQAGQITQGQFAVAIGDNAGNNAQGTDAVAIGASAGLNTQGNGAVALGQGTGETSQGANAVALGKAAGQVNQGINSVAIGQIAGQTNQGNNSIILNATGSALDQTIANTFTVAPVRNDVANTAQVMFYNTTSKEITYGNTISVAGNIVGGNLTVGSGTITGGNVNGANFNGNVAFGTGTVGGSGNIAGGNISAVGNVTGNYFIGNGSQLTGIAASYGNANVATFLAAYGSNTITTTGNITAGNLIGNISITGNVTGTSANVTLVAGAYSWTFDNTGNTQGNLSLTGANITINNAPGGVEGAEIQWALPSAANTVLSGTLVQDVYQNGMRFFESGGSSRGLYMDLGNVPNGAGTAVGYRDVPQVSFTANATLAATDAGKHYYSTLATANTLTIANNTSVSWSVGTAISIVNRGTGNITIVQGTGVSLYLAGNSTATNRTISTYGMATLLNVAANVWMINGTGVS